jgi:hypothetical protein
MTEQPGVDRRDHPDFGEVPERDSELGLALELLEEVESDLMIMGGDTKGYRPRLDSPPLSHPEKAAMERANEMRDTIQQVIMILESMRKGV